MKDLRDLIILFKYLGFFLDNTSESQQIKQTKKSEKNPNKIHNKKSVTNYATMHLLSFLLGLLPMGIILFVLNFQIYRNLYDALKSYSQYRQVGVLFYFTNMTTFSLFYIVGFAGTGMYAFSRSEEMEFLLTLPIKRRVLTLYNLIFSIFNQLFTLIFFLATTLGYMIGFKVYTVDFILRTFLQLYFLTIISALIAVLFGGVASRRVVKKLNTFLLLFLVFIFLGLSYLQDLDLNQLDQNGNLEALLRWMALASSKWNVISWAYSEDALYLILSIIISILSTALFWYYSEKVIYEEVRERKKKGYEKHKKYADYANITDKKISLKYLLIHKITPGPFFWKDWKLLLRNDQFIFLLFYPFAFGLFMVFISNNPISAVIPFFVVATLYAALESGIITLNEFKYKETIDVLPVKSKDVILPKVIIPVTLNLFCLIGLILASVLTKKFTKLFFAYVPLSFSLFYLASIIGAYYSIKKPGKKPNQPFSTLATFKIEGLTLSLASGTFLPLLTIFSTPSTKHIPAWVVYISWTAFISSLLITIILIVVYYRKLRKILEEKQ